MSFLKEVISDLGGKKKGIKVTRLSEREDETKDLKLIAELKDYIKEVKRLIRPLEKDPRTVGDLIDHFQAIDSVIAELEASEKAEMEKV